MRLKKLNISGKFRCLKLSGSVQNVIRIVGIVKKTFTTVWKIKLTLQHVKDNHQKRTTSA